TVATMTPTQLMRFMSSPSRKARREGRCGKATPDRRVVKERRSVKLGGDAVGEAAEGVGLGHGGVTVTLHRPIRPARDDVEMQVEDGLAAGLAVELHDLEALGLQ